MARPTEEGTHFHPADSNTRGFQSSSPPLVSKVTTQDAVGPSRRRDKLLGPALRSGVPQDLRASAGAAVRAGAVGRRGDAVPSGYAREDPCWAPVVVVGGLPGAQGGGW